MITHNDSHKNSEHQPQYWNHTVNFTDVHPYVFNIFFFMLVIFCYLFERIVRNQGEEQWQLANRECSGVAPALTTLPRIRHKKHIKIFQNIFIYLFILTCKINIL